MQTAETKQMLITETNKYSTSDIAKWIRQELKKEFKGEGLKFSVKTEFYSMGSSIHLSILSSEKIRFIKRPDEISELEILRLMNARNATKEEIKSMIQQRQNSEHFQINQYHIDSDWQFTEEGKQIIKRVLRIADQHNWDKSDSMIDYFDVNYYLHLKLGKCDKPFIDGVGFRSKSLMKSWCHSCEMDSTNSITSWMSPQDVCSICEEFKTKGANNDMDKTRS